MKYLVVILLLVTSYSAQWNNEWTSASFDYNTLSGWISFEKIAQDKWKKSFYTLDASSFNVMDNAYPTALRYSYSFSQSEIDAGYQIYSLGVDLTGDNITEFYVLGYYGSSDNYRQSFKILDITNNNIVLEKNSDSYYYSYPVIWDVDNDGTLECTFTEYDYPSYASYRYMVLNTGITTSVSKTENLNKGFKLSNNYPNPFNPTTIINYEVNHPSKVNIDIYDVKGELIQNLINDFHQTGNYQLEWNGTDKHGNKVSSGAYFYQMKADDFISTKKMIYLK